MVDSRIGDGELLVAAGGALAADALLRGVESVRYRRPSPIELLEPQPTALVTFPTESQRPSAVVVRNANGGELAAIGMPTWWRMAGDAPGNAALLQNLLNRPSRR